MENSYIIKEKVINKPKLLKVGVAQVVKEVFQFQIPYWLPNPIILLDPIPFLGLDLIDPRSSSILCLTLLWLILCVRTNPTPFPHHPHPDRHLLSRPAPICFWYPDLLGLNSLVISSQPPMHCLSSKLLPLKWFLHFCLRNVSGNVRTSEQFPQRSELNAALVVSRWMQIVGNIVTLRHMTVTRHSVTWRHLHSPSNYRVLWCLVIW